MPRYVNEKLTSWKTQGFMEFEKYDVFQERYKKILLEKDKNLVTFLFFTGASPQEVVNLRRDDITCEDHKLKFRIRRIGKDNKERALRFIEWPFKYPELHAFWDWVKQLPNDFFIFSWFHLPGSGAGNPREYIRKHVGDAAYFFRHNINSLIVLLLAFLSLYLSTPL